MGITQKLACQVKPGAILVQSSNPRNGARSLNESFWYSSRQLGEPQVVYLSDKRTIQPCGLRLYDDNWDACKSRRTRGQRCFHMRFLAQPGELSLR